MMKFDHRKLGFDFQGWVVILEETISIQPTRWLENSKKNCNICSLLIRKNP